MPRTGKLFLGGLLIGLMGAGEMQGWCADSSTTNAAPQATTENAATVDVLMNLFVKKGFVSQEEVDQVKAEAEAYQTNVITPSALSHLKLSEGVVGAELFGDVRVRYEDREAKDPSYGNVDLQRERYSVRLGIKGTLFDDFYYGVRLQTGENARSSWITAGTSASGSPYNGPYGDTTATLSIGQAYMGWRQGDWLDVTLGKMPNPLYTTPMVWSGNINPEGAAEQFKYTVGKADFFATFGQFVYQNLSPNNISAGLGGLNSFSQSTPNIYQLAWEGGLTYHITDKLKAKAGATIYQYFGLQSTTQQSATSTDPSYAPYYSDTYIGQGIYSGPGTPNTVNGPSGYPYGSWSQPGYASQDYPNNQVGLNNLLVLEVPAEISYRFSHATARIFGDFAYNFQGTQRADAASTGYAQYLKAGGYPPSTSSAQIGTFAPQTSQVRAYQIGFGLGSTNVEYGQTQGLVYGTGSAKNAWEVRAFWQHIEQYSLDPNLLDNDFFNGLENLQGVYVAVAYGLSDNVIGTIRYGYATRIDNTIGTGGTSGDIPQINPVEHYNILQLDMTVRF